jgi:hypothetical protein
MVIQEVVEDRPASTLSETMRPCLAIFRRLLIGEKTAPLPSATA